MFSRRQAPTAKSLDLNHAIERSEATRYAGLMVSLSREPAPVYARQEEIEPIIRDLSGKVRSDFPSAGIEVKTALINLDEESCRRCAGAQPGHYAVLSIGNLNGGPEARDLFVQPCFAEAMQARESAAMGLAATHATVAQCGGFIVAVNAIPAGAAHASFHVFLPCPTARADVSPLPPASAAGETILLVEDEPLIRELSRDMLERQGYRVILAANAKEAEQIGGRAGTFDLLVTDTVMPNITGAELARRLRAVHPGLKVLFISGYADNAEERDETGADGAAFLQKPFSADSLGRKIRQMLSRAE